MADGSDGNGGNAGFHSLLRVMPKIAEAVKDLPTELQGKAFDALVAAHQGGGGTATVDPPAGSTTKQPRKGGASRKRSGTESNGSTDKRRRSSSGAPTRVKGLDLVPKGKQSLKAFVDEKKPKGQAEQNTVVVYWLKEVARIADPVTVNHVFTCYRADLGWKLPGSVANSLRVTASTKGYLDTSNRDDIRLEPAGTNLIEHGLPRPAKA